MMSQDNTYQAKVLTLSVVVWNKESGSDTLSNLFSGYDPDKLANVYFKSGIPDSSVSKRYFYISENSVIKSIFKPKTVTGMEVEAAQDKGDAQHHHDEIMERESATEKARYRFFSRHRLWIFQYIREILWKIGRWKSKALDDFVTDFAPDVLFFPIEGYIYFNRVTEYVIKKSGVPAVGIIWDDNFTYKVHPHNVGFRIHRFFLRKRVRRLAQSCTKLFVMTPKMQKELQEEFGLSSEVLTKGAVLPSNDSTAASDLPLEETRPIQIVYTGKLNLGRIQSVQLLADVLDEMNADKLSFELYIYSGTFLNEREKESLNKKGCHFMGSVTQDKIAEIQERADVLLLAEALKGKNRNVARLSFSTKTVDYLSHGKCMLYIGTADNASSEYLQEHKAALIASSRAELTDVLHALLSDSTMIEEYRNNAKELARRNHDIKCTQARLYAALETGAKSSEK